LYKTPEQLNYLRRFDSVPLNVRNPFCQAGRGSKRALKIVGTKSAQRGIIFKGIRQ
jgi:hypothetical protein